MLKFEKNTVQGTHGHYVAHSERTGLTYVLSRIPMSEWLLQVFCTIAYPGGALSYDPSSEYWARAGSLKKGLVAEANRIDADEPTASGKVIAREVSA